MSSRRNSRASRDGRQALELAEARLGQLPGRARAELHGGVAVALDGPQRGDGIRFDGHHGDGHDGAVRGEDRGHANFLADQADTHLHLDLDVDARGKRESHQGVHRLGRGVEDVDQPLVGADLELLAAVLVDER